MVLAGYGLNHEQIAEIIGLRSAKTLRKYFKVSSLAGKPRLTRKWRKRSTSWSKGRLHG